MLSKTSLRSSDNRQQPHLVVKRVVTDQKRCMQCGICSFNCPVGIDVRAYAWLGEPVNDSKCLACGLCLARCPRRALQFEPIQPLTRTPS